MPISEERLEKLKEFEEQIGYTFKDKNLIDVAFTHSSYTNEAKGNVKSNERLEFLGDSILDMIVSELLFKHYNDHTEGWLTKTRARLVCTESFAIASEKYDMTSFLKFGKGEKKLQGYLKKHVKADTFEAVCAAIYLDSSYQNLSELLLDRYKSEAQAIIDDTTIFNDYKSKLQEYYNSHGKKILKYKLIEEVGPEHQKTFTMAVMAEDRELAKGSGRNKKKAEQMAAKNAYERIKNE